jgi:positive regulator of sigma E activity
MARVAGTVVEVRDGRAWIDCTDTAAAGCSACATGLGCAWRSRAGPRRLETPGHVDGRPLQAGEAVELETDARSLLRAAAWAYLAPLAGLIGGPTLLRLGGWDAGLAPLAAAAAGLVVGSLLARRITREAPAVVVHRS